MAALDTQFINVIISEAIETLRVQCKVDAIAGKPVLKGHAPRPTMDVGAAIHVASTCYDGTFAMMFTSKCYLAILKSWMDEAPPQIDQDSASGAAELVNIVFGSAKAKWTESGHKVAMARPQIFIGSSLKLFSERAPQSLIVPLTGSCGDFQIEIFFKRVELIVANQKTGG